MMDVIFTAVIILILYAFATVMFIGAWWMFEQTEIGETLLEWLKKRKEE